MKILSSKKKIKLESNVYNRARSTPRIEIVHKIIEFLWSKLSIQYSEHVQSVFTNKGTNKTFESFVSICMQITDSDFSASLAWKGDGAKNIIATSPKINQ